MALTLVEANRMVQAAINKANELNVKESIAVFEASRAANGTADC